jgi:hypothetical protein
MKWTKLVIEGKTTNYIISNTGEIINTKTGHSISKYLSDGYIRATLKSHRNYHSWNVARIMLASFYNDDGFDKIY